MSVSSTIHFSIYAPLNGTPLRQNTPCDIFLSFIENGWKYENNGIVHHLPLGDKEVYNWQDAVFSLNEIKTLIEKKLKAYETLGFTLVKKLDSLLNEEIGETGIDLLYFIDYKSYSVLLTTYRKKTTEGITDVSWYLSEIYKIVRHAGYEIEFVEFTEHV
jgi:hypothetical protein